MPAGGRVVVGAATTGLTVTDEGHIWCGTAKQPATPVVGHRTYTRLPSRYTETVCLGMGDESNIWQENGKGHKIQHTGLPLQECRYGLRGAEMMGPVARLSYVCRKCPCNLHNSLCNRHLCLPKFKLPDDMPYTTIFSEAIVFYNRDLKRLVVEYDRKVPEVYANWWSKWGETKRQQILKALSQDLEYRPDRVSTFIKRENNMSFPSKARSIQGYKDLSAQFLTAKPVTVAQKAFAAVYGVHHYEDGIGLTFASGLDCATLGDWMTTTMSLFPNAYFYERDGKNWDSTMLSQHFHLKFFVENEMISDSAAREALLKGQFVKCRVRWGDNEVVIKYQSSWTVKSGHNDTSLGNSIINAAVAIQAARTLGYPVRILVMGDDLLVASQSKIDGEKFSAIERQCGITPEYAVFQDPLKVTFVSQWFYPTGRADHRYFTGPKPGRILGKLCWSVTKIRERDRKAWVHSVVMGLWSICQHIPVIRAFLERIDDLADTEKIVATQKYDKYFRCAVQVDEETVMDAFCDRYSISRSEVFELEDYLRGIPDLMVFLAHPLIDHIISVDTADPAERFSAAGVLHWA